MAAFIMRGPGEAVLVVGLTGLLSLMVPFLARRFPYSVGGGTVTGLLSLMVPFLGLLSSGALALVTLRWGTRDGLRIGALAGLGCLLAAWLMQGSVLPVLVMAFVMWLPVWGLGVLLRFSRSLAFTAQAAALAGVGTVLVAHALIPDQSEAWLRVLAPLQNALVQDGTMEKPAVGAALGVLAPWLTGVFAAALMLQLLLGLWLGRWWQALLYNPGGFGADFRAFRLHPVLGAGGLLLIGISSLDPGPGLVPDLILVLSPLWLFQGLAVIHQLWQRHWLVGFYVLLVLLMPQSLVLVACLGLVDILVDLRARLGRPPPA